MRGLRQRTPALFRPGQFLRYLCVGVFNTLFGYCLYTTILTLLSHMLPIRYLYVSAMLASVISTPINTTVAYLGYKFFVFRTKGRYLSEWLKSFGVYGSAMLVGLVVLGSLTKFLQSVIHRNSSSLHAGLAMVEAHLSGRPLALVQRVTEGHAMAGYLAGAIVIGGSTIYSFIGHKKVTFRRNPSTDDRV